MFHRLGHCSGRWGWHVSALCQLHLPQQWPNLWNTGLVRTTGPIYGIPRYFNVWLIKLCAQMFLEKHSRRLKGQKSPWSLKISPLWNRNGVYGPTDFAVQHTICRSIYSELCEATQSCHKSDTVIIEILQGSGQIKICRSQNSKWGLLLKAYKI